VRLDLTALLRWRVLVRVERGEHAQPRRVGAGAQIEQAAGVGQLAGEAERRLQGASAAQRLAVRVIRARLQHGVGAAGHRAQAAQPVHQRPLPAAGAVPLAVQAGGTVDGLADRGRDGG
jgi:hypothetical protein